MTFLVRRITIFFLIFELVIFIVLYCFGPKGLSKINDLKDKHIKTRQDIALLEEEITTLKQNILAGQSDFAKEKIAREKLLMKKDQESVYFT